ncbi:MAG: helix-turn-helix domain-containing protein [Microthrixaceae bacterium]|nr:helix-turn-helix domain-containing protein [Microthrixaceae bacterium]
MRLVDRWSIEATEWFPVDPTTVRKWRVPFLAEGEIGLRDRSSRPKRALNRTPRRVRSLLIQLRKRRRWGADRIAITSGSPFDGKHLLRHAGLGRLDRGDRATALPVRRYRECQINGGTGLA